ncbi:SPFH domain-containing protein [Ideonella sp. 4Y16]|uniref:SPFH domain-containing protein n=1 Tax=Ideonella alba TaxID=2824118 RepID=UPI001B376771|nr:SPFH domain-containing protein [Ideonella alba]MBQ0944768.1 SPFH domain-containing protein [Ideonella alba]
MDRSEHVERSATTTSGYPIVLLIAGLAGTAAWQVFQLADDRGSFLVMGVSVVLAVLLASGLYMLQPNTGALLMLFGAYQGTDRREGLRWSNPLLLKRTVSLRARTLNMSTLKVNDKRGNPVEIAAAVVWQVHDTAQASFSVDDVERFVALQAESALRHLASRYAYDDGDVDADAGQEPTLRGSLDEVAQALQAELQQRFGPAGVRVVDAKLTHLAYAPEIAQAMLRRQQAEAVIAARTKIVHGAVSMVEAALKGLSEREIVQLDDERKAAMVSNLLVVLCSDKDTQPIVNTGTLYN